MEGLGPKVYRVQSLTFRVYGMGLNKLDGAVSTRFAALG